MASSEHNGAATETADVPAGSARIESGRADRSRTPAISHGAKIKLIDTIRLAIKPGECSEAAEPETLSPAELHRLYAGTSVPQHRYLATALNEAVNSPELAPHPARWLAGVNGIELCKVVNAWLKTNRSTEYEQLYCIGLDPDTGRLTGVLTVKKGSGYSGGPRTAGSKEHVAFWVDWGSGFHYEGTASATVYDFGWLPPAGLEYNVSLKFDLLSRLRALRNGRRTVKVRAVLSWDTPPSASDPYAPVVWGNSMECRILIPPRHDALIGDHASCASTARVFEMGRARDDGRIVDATIRALTEMFIGPYAGLTVAPFASEAGRGATERSFTINAREIEDGGCASTLHIWNSSQGPRGARSSSN